mgnify:CR=1 FL=1
MNDVNNRIFREFTMFLGDVGKKSPELSVSAAYEITIKSTICTALMTLNAENGLNSRYWNHLRVQSNILDFLYQLWLSSGYSLADDFSTIMKNLVEYDFTITESMMKERMKSA